MRVQYSEVRVRENKNKNKHKHKAKHKKQKQKNKKRIKIGGAFRSHFLGLQALSLSLNGTFSSSFHLSLSLTLIYIHIFPVSQSVTIFYLFIYFLGCFKMFYGLMVCNILVPRNVRFAVWEYHISQVSSRSGLIQPFMCFKK